MLRNKKTLLMAFAILLVLSLVFASCSPKTTPETPADTSTEEEATQPAGAEADEPVILRVGGMSVIDCWNPYTCTSIWFYGHLVVEGFADHGPASSGCEGVPRLADSWEVSDDGMTWTIKLHENITFSDGTPLTAQTVVDFINWHNSTELVWWMPEATEMLSIEAVDELTVQYTTGVPISASPNLDFIWWYVLPPHIWGELDDETLWDFENYPPVGTGPYVVTEHEPGSHIIFDAREDYYRGKPPIDRVVYQIYSNNDALISALLSGEIDLTLPAMPLESYDQLVAGENITVEEKPPGAWTELAFNLHPEGIKHPAIDDLKVREAIDYAIDKDQIIEQALLGHGITCPTNWGCGPNYESELNPDLEVTPFDLAKASQILDEAGYEDTDNDGVRETPDGEPLIFRLAYQASVPAQLVMADLISGWLGEIGIEVDVEALEVTTWFATILDERNYDMALDTATHDIDAASMNFWYSCWSADAGSGALNYSGYCNEELDELVYEYIYSDDLEARWEPMFKAQEILNQERSIIILAGENSLQAYRNDRFEFPMDTCDVGLGMMDPLSLLNATVK